MRESTPLIVGGGMVGTFGTAVFMAKSTSSFSSFWLTVFFFESLITRLLFQNWLSRGPRKSQQWAKNTGIDGAEACLRKRGFTNFFEKKWKICGYWANIPGLGYHLGVRIHHDWQRLQWLSRLDLVASRNPHDPTLKVLLHRLLLSPSQPPKPWSILWLQSAVKISNLSWLHEIINHLRNLHVMPKSVSKGFGLVMKTGSWRWLWKGNHR